MNAAYPIYTSETECQDCYKCVRNCPVKAIRIKDGIASVIPDMCICCGTCVEVCPARAKQVRSDLGRARNLVMQSRLVYASLAPSFITEFPGIGKRKMAAALQKMGFAGVSETALGAQEVSAGAAELILKKERNVLISTACPVVVQYILKYKPELSDCLTGLYSPMQAHAALLRKTFGSEIKVVFIGPCIAKKLESDENRNLVDVAITFKDLHEWFKEEQIDFDTLVPDEKAVFVPEQAREGVLYPVDGGMTSGIRALVSESADCRFMEFSGMDNVTAALDELEPMAGQTSVFLELLACSGGCVNGPGSTTRNATVKKINQVIDFMNPALRAPVKTPQVQVNANYRPLQVPRSQHDDAKIEEILKKTGKRSTRDELNCGGCGYNNCREFAQAVLDGKAELSMCVTHMRQLAMKKANQLIKTMPSGVVIVDDTLRIVECNRNFARIAGGNTEMVYDAKPGMEGALLEKILPSVQLFRHVLETGEDILEKEIRLGKAIVQCSIFTIEKNHTVGGVFQDITQPLVKKEQIIRKARKVIQKNLTTVQKIAYLLGENASETEMTLESIIDSFLPSGVEDDKN